MPVISHYCHLSLVRVCEHLDARRQLWLALLSANEPPCSLSAWDLLTRLNQMPSEPLGSSWLHFLCVGVTGTHCCSQLFTWVLGIELWSSGWHCKDLLSHFPRLLGCVPVHHCNCGMRSHGSACCVHGTGYRACLLAPLSRKTGWGELSAEVTAIYLTSMGRWAPS